MWSSRGSRDRIFDWAMLNGGCEKRRKGLHFPAFCVKVSLHD
ncbi:hypothetical protein GCWU000341_02181 [Oribacterium sp. oral taxon 078 str. F0262]|nr:hypothetical protein GCWU000341_02181 [Oribacterium sp. oral taxon 078 str. F0262]